MCPCDTKGEKRKHAGFWRDVGGKPNKFNVQAKILKSIKTNNKGLGSEGL
jgi:hypothetical protein